MRAPAGPSNSSLQTCTHGGVDGVDAVGGVLRVHASEALMASAQAVPIRLREERVLVCQFIDRIISFGRLITRFAV
jgi:hypothetical protein